MILSLSNDDGCSKLWFSIDRTNWEFGETDHNLLVLAVQIRDISVPILWTALPSAGNSDYATRIELMKDLLTFFPKERVAGLLGDREFIGHHWFEWLQKEKIPFIIRIKDNHNITLKDGRKYKLRDYLRGLPYGVNSHVMENVVFAHGLKLNLQAKKLPAKKFGGGFLIVAFASGFAEYEAMPINLYRHRWKIVCGFSALKTKGFNLEDTHLRHKLRLETLMAVVVIAMAICITVGKLAKKPTQKNHGYNANCLFTSGLKIIVHAISRNLNIPWQPLPSFNLRNVLKDAVV